MGEGWGLWGNKSCPDTTLSSAINKTFSFCAILRVQYININIFVSPAEIMYGVLLTSVGFYDQFYAYHIYKSYKKKVGEKVQNTTTDMQIVYLYKIYEISRKIFYKIVVSCATLGIMRNPTPVGLAVLLGVIFCGKAYCSSRASIKNNGYEDVVVAINPSVPEDPALLESLKVCNNEFSPSSFLFQLILINCQKVV